MAINKEELEQLRDIIREEVPVLVREEIRSELQPIREDLRAIKLRLDRFFEMESGDIKAAYLEIDSLKKQVKKLEHRIAALEGT